MASVKVKLNTNRTKKDENTHQIVLQVIHNRVRRIIGLKHYALPSQWDEKNSKVKNSFPNSKRMNTFILHKKNEVDELRCKVYKENKISYNFIKGLHFEEYDGDFVQWKLF